MEKQYTYDLQIVFDGTGDAMVVRAFNSYLRDPEQVKIEVKRLLVVHVHPAEVDQQEPKSGLIRAVAR